MKSSCMNSDKKAVSLNRHTRRVPPRKTKWALAYREGFRNPIDILDSSRTAKDAQLSLHVPRRLPEFKIFEFFFVLRFRRIRNSVSSTVFADVHDFLHIIKSTEAEWKTILEQGGFPYYKVIKIPTILSIIESFME
ncbi:hypothetical protein E3N88_12439 [Mikania micrantha]|uniref:Uncharacterized protein n=1 Tax=Mikania micrantha TaxID=192012 RepID=A0A5N6P5P2_9ASTR|nr:hypothetical protein E3N88_12439 [Mikania micrantha]